MFLGKLADQAGEGERVIDAPHPLDWNGLLDRFEPGLAAALRGEKIRVAVNGALMPNKFELRAGGDDEIAFLPPVSGG